jgi:hypothetical protein
MQTLVERGCGVDVHQATVVACLLTVLKNGTVQKRMRAFGTTTRELMSLREWLLSEGLGSRHKRGKSDASVCSGVGNRELNRFN